MWFTFYGKDNWGYLNESNWFLHIWRDPCWLQATAGFHASYNGYFGFGLLFKKTKQELGHDLFKCGQDTHLSSLFLWMPGVLGHYADWEDFVHLQSSLWTWYLEDGQHIVKTIELVTTRGRDAHQFGWLPQDKRAMGSAMFTVHMYKLITLGTYFYHPFPVWTINIPVTASQVSNVNHEFSTKIRRFYFGTIWRMVLPRLQVDFWVGFVFWWLF